MISLKGSKFYVELIDDEHHVYIRRPNEYVEITDKLTNRDKDELINDLIYSILDLLKDNE